MKLRVQAATPVGAAVEMIRATTPDKRLNWQYGSAGRSDNVPF
jgi:hypothetical protein